MGGRDGQARPQACLLYTSVMTDVAPFTLGISVSHKGEDGVRTSGLFMPIIERNTVIPASRVKVVTTIEDNQTSLNLEVFQGEAPLVKDNIKLGTMKLRLPPAREGEVGVGVRFTYDPSGLLEVEATVDKTGVTQRVVIEGNPGALSPQEVAERLEKLSALKLNPRDDAGNAALLSRAQRLFEQRLGQMCIRDRSRPCNWSGCRGSRPPPGRRRRSAWWCRIFRSALGPPRNRECRRIGLQDSMQQRIKRR